MIHDINLEIYSPSLFILYGKSGSGKSTLLNLISGLQKQQKGKLFLIAKYSKIENQEYLIYIKIIL